MRLLDAPLAIVDLETTGAHPAHDRVTEIAVIEAEDGAVTGEWSTLVNPGAAIPAAIQALTGITNAMVADAPRFEALAAELLARLEGRVLVAHNARFDYGFLRHEFERAGLAFRARTLCTVKLSRRLYPHEARHNLDSVMQRHGIACKARHRAMGDAEAVWQFLRIAAAEQGEEVVAVAARQVARHATLPAHLDRAMVDAVPEAPGVYLFYGEGAAPLYVGKSIAMRSRVLAHFADDLRSAKEMQMAREVRRIEWRRTAGELGALLLEARLVKELAPAFNRQLRRQAGLCGFAFDGKALALRQVEDFAPEGLDHLRGLFRTRRAALEALRGIADEHGLCLQALGFESARRGACFRHQIARCAGLCAGKEGVREHHARLAAALGALPGLAWPWRGPVGVIEVDAAREATELHVVDRWRYLGTARSEDEVPALLEDARRAAARFDPDQYKVLARFLRARRARVRELACTPS
jgi:DNA polymerase-3 subunit epsilon